MNEFLKGILDGINTVIGNYGWSIVIYPAAAHCAVPLRLQEPGEHAQNHQAATPARRAAKKVRQ